MRIANIAGQAAVERDGAWHDVELSSGGAFPSSPRALLSRLDELAAWLSSATFEQPGQTDPVFGPPIPDPAQIVAIGLNYRKHAEETGSPLPEHPMVFTKFASALAGSTDPISLPTDTVDWEAELVVVIGKEAHDIEKSEAMHYVAGYMNGQDISERGLQSRGARPQFSLAKSYPGFAPTGPYLVTLDELGDPHDLSIKTTLIKDDGEVEVVQDARTSDLIFDVPTLVWELARVIRLQPGDLIFTGTPSGVGLGRDPKMFLEAGWRVHTELEGLGAMDNPVG